MSASDQLRALQRQIATIPAAMQRQLGARLARVGLDLVKRGVAASRDPYGQPFAPLAGSSRPPLRRIVGVFAASATGNGFGIRAGRDYVRYHQEGAVIPAHRGGGERLFDLRTGRFLSGAKASRKKLVGVTQGAATHSAGILPKRQLVPQASTGGMGEAWGSAINASADEWLRTHLSR